MFEWIYHTIFNNRFILKSSLFDCLSILGISIGHMDYFLLGVYYHVSSFILRCTLVFQLDGSWNSSMCSCNCNYISCQAYDLHFMKETQGHIPMSILGISCGHGIPWGHIILCLSIPFHKIPQRCYDNDHSSITYNNIIPWDNARLYFW